MSSIIKNRPQGVSEAGFGAVGIRIIELSLRAFSLWRSSSAVLEFLGSSKSCSVGFVYDAQTPKILDNVVDAHFVQDTSTSPILIAFFEIRL